MTDREIWALAEGLVLGLLFLLAIAASLAAISTLRQRFHDVAVPADRHRELRPDSASSQVHLI